MGENCHDRLHGAVHDRVQLFLFACTERFQYMLDHVTTASRTPDTDAQPGKIPIAQGLH